MKAATVASNLGSFRMAFALASRFAAPAAMLAALVLAACGGQTNTVAADGFKPVPVTPVIGDVPLGNASAPVTVEEYASYTCSHCRDFWKQEFPRLKTEYIDTGKVKFVYRDYPLDDSLAVMLASIARCKGADSYFTVVDDIFSQQYEILSAAQKGEAAPCCSPSRKRTASTRTSFGPASTISRRSRRPSSNRAKTAPRAACVRHRLSSSMACSLRPAATSP